jgi:hypothetical protein
MTLQSGAGDAQPLRIHHSAPVQSQDCSLLQVLTCISATMDASLLVQTICNAFDMLLVRRVADSGNIAKLMRIFLEPVTRNRIRQW